MGSAGINEQDSLVLDLGALGSTSLAVVGGKALNLGRLVAAGLPAPLGFCLSTVAYRMAAPPELAALAEHLDGAGPGKAPAGGELGELSRRAREMIVTAPIPHEVDAAVRAAYAGLGASPAVAVRSSATAEDLPLTSFAGQQDSFLDIVGADAVVQSVRRCWASLWTERAVAYRSSNGISHRDVGLAVVVQNLVPAKAAGVLFTANPVTGTRTETVIDASHGPGQAVVSGAVNPDHFVVDTSTGKVLLRSPGGQEPGRRPSLTDARIRELTALGDTVQRLFGTPQDIEWVIDADGKLWLTQSRPITTLYPLPDAAAEPPAGIGSPAPAGTRVYMCGTLLQGLTRPITPMGLAVLGAMRNRSGIWQYVNPGLRMYVDLTPLVRNKYGRHYLQRVLPLADGRSGAVFPALLEDPRFAVTKRSARNSVAESGDAPGTAGSTGGASLLLVLRLIPALIAGGAAARGGAGPGPGLRKAARRGAGAARTRHRLPPARPHQTHPGSNCGRVDTGNPAGTFGRLHHAGRGPQAAPRHREAAGTGGSAAGPAQQCHHRDGP